MIKKIIDGFNIRKEAEELGVSVWKAPSFLFIIMGLIIVSVMTAVYYLSKIYDSPELLVLSESSVVAILLIIGNTIIKSVTEIAKANKMKTEFVSIASHQLKTPLAEVNWEIELLVSKFKEGLSLKQLEIIEQIAKSNKKMGRLVNDLLDVARIDQGKLALNPENIDIIEIIKNAVLENKMLASVNNVKVNVFTDGDVPKIYVDRRKMEVVIDNLLTNAIKYTKQEGLVEINVKNNEGDFVEINFSDNGLGIPKNQQEKIFQKFFRSENAVKNQTEGTGLGLYIVKNIVEQSGGHIWFNSKENEGSVFSIMLPIKSN